MLHWHRQVYIDSPSFELSSFLPSLQPKAPCTIISTTINPFDYRTRQVQTEPSTKMAPCSCSSCSCSGDCGSCGCSSCGVSLNHLEQATQYTLADGPLRSALNDANLLLQHVEIESWRVKLRKRMRNVIHKLGEAMRVTLVEPTYILSCAASCIYMTSNHTLLI